MCGIDYLFKHEPALLVSLNGSIALIPHYRWSPHVLQPLNEKNRKKKNVSFIRVHRTPNPHFCLVLAVVSSQFLQPFRPPIETGAFQSRVLD